MLAAALSQVAAALHAAEDPWWVIGSAAVRLHGVETSVADVDVLLSARDAARMLALWPGMVTIGAASARFSSHPFARLAGGAMPVEVMAELEVLSRGIWCAVRPASRVTVGDVFVPARGELVAILRLFGRPQDVVRAALLG